MPGERPQQSRFAGAVAPEHKESFAGAQIEIDAVDDRTPAAFDAQALRDKPFRLMGFGQGGATFLATRDELRAFRNYCLCSLLAQIYL